MNNDTSKSFIKLIYGFAIAKYDFDKFGVKDSEIIHLPCRNAIIQFLLIRKYRSNVLSRIPMDVIRMIVRYVWRDRENFLGFYKLPKVYYMPTCDDDDISSDTDDNRNNNDNNNNDDSVDVCSWRCPYVGYEYGWMADIFSQKIMSFEYPDGSCDLQLSGHTLTSVGTELLTKYYIGAIPSLRSYTLKRYSILQNVNTVCRASGHIMYGYFCDEHIKDQILPIYGHRSGVQVNVAVVKIAHTFTKGLYTTFRAPDRKYHLRKNKFVGIILDTIYGVKDSEDAAHNAEIIHKKYMSRDVELPSRRDILGIMRNIHRKEIEDNDENRLKRGTIYFMNDSDIDQKPKLMFIPTICHCSKYAHWQ